MFYKCFLCQGKLSKIVKIIQKKKVLECPKCLLAKTVFQNRINQKKNLVRFYDFFCYKMQQERLERRFAIIAKKIIDQCSEGKVLDVGSGFGLASFVLNRFGKFNFYLIEPYLPVRFYKKSKTKIFKQSIEFFLKKNQENFEIILCLDVLEHLKQPLFILRKLKRRLSNKGIIVIQAPNYKSLMSMLSVDWPWWFVEEHRYHFSPKSLKMVLEKADLRVIRLETYESFYEFKKSLDGNFQAIKNDFLRKVTKIFFYSFLIPFYFTLRPILWRLGFGGLILVIAKRKT